MPEYGSDLGDEPVIAIDDDLVLDSSVLNRLRQVYNLHVLILLVSIVTLSLRRFHQVIQIDPYFIFHSFASRLSDVNVGRLVRG